MSMNDNGQQKWQKKMEFLPHAFENTRFKCDLDITIKTLKIKTVLISIFKES